MCYHSLSEAKAAYMRSRSIPVLAYIDDAFYANYAVTFAKHDELQWRAGAEDLCLGIMVSFRWATSSRTPSATSTPSQVQKYFGIICDSTTASFRVPDDKLFAQAQAPRLRRAGARCGLHHDGPAGEDRGEVREHGRRHPPRVPRDPLHVRGDQQRERLRDPAEITPRPPRQALGLSATSQEGSWF